MSKSRFLLMHFQLSIIVLGKPVSHFIEMTMLINKVVTLIQIKMRAGSVKFSNMGPMWGLSNDITHVFHVFFYLQYYCFG